MEAMDGNVFVRRHGRCEMTREQLAELADLAHAENDATHALSEIRALSGNQYIRGVMDAQGCVYAAARKVAAYLSGLEGSAECYHCNHLYADFTRWLARGALYVSAWWPQEDVFYCPSCWTTCS